MCEKIKGNIHKTLSPISVDKSVHKFVDSTKILAFFYFHYDFAYKIGIGLRLSRTTTYGVNIY